MEVSDDSSSHRSAAAGPAAAWLSASNGPRPWLAFVMGGRRLALALDAVEQVLAAAAVTPVPAADDWLLGIIDLHGEILPVLDLRTPRRALAASDHFLIVRTRRRRLALLIEQPLGVIDAAPLPAQAVAAALPDAQRFQGVLYDADRALALIHDPEGFLSAAQAQRLDVLLDTLADAAHRKPAVPGGAREDGDARH